MTVNNTKKKSIFKNKTFFIFAYVFCCVFYGSCDLCEIIEISNVHIYIYVWMV